MPRKKPESWWRTKAQALDRDDHRCVYCGDAEPPFVGDHLVPLARGGGWELRNIVTACRGCNAEKGAMTVDEWRAKREGAGLQWPPR